MWERMSKGRENETMKGGREGEKLCSLWNINPQTIGGRYSLISPNNIYLLALLPVIYKVISPFSLFLRNDTKCFHDLTHCINTTTSHDLLFVTHLLVLSIPFPCYIYCMQHSNTCLPLTHPSQGFVSLLLLRIPA